MSCHPGFEVFWLPHDGTPRSGTILPDTRAALIHYYDHSLRLELSSGHVERIASPKTPSHVALKEAVEGVLTSPVVALARSEAHALALTEARQLVQLHAETLEVTSRLELGPTLVAYGQDAVGLSPDGRWRWVQRSQSRMRLYEDETLRLELRGDTPLSRSQLRYLPGERLLSDTLILDLSSQTPIAPVLGRMRLIDATPDGSLALYTLNSWAVLVQPNALLGPHPPGLFEQRPSLALSPSGRYLAVGGEETGVWVYDRESETMPRRLETLHRAFSGRGLCFLDDERLCITSEGAALETWRWREPRLVEVWTPDDGQLRCERLVSDAGRRRLACVGHSAVVVRDLERGTHRVLGPWEHTRHGYTREARVQDVAMHPEGTHVAIALEYGEVPGHVVALESGEVTGLGKVRQVAFDPRGAWLLTRQQVGRLERWPERVAHPVEQPPFDAALFCKTSEHWIWQHQRTFGKRLLGEENDAWVVELRDDVSDALLTPEDALLTGSQQGWVGLRDAECTLERVLPSASGGRVTCLAWTAAGDLLVGEGGGRLALWDLTGERLAFADSTPLRDTDTLDYGALGEVVAMRCTEEALEVVGHRRWIWPVVEGRPALDEAPRVVEQGEEVVALCGRTGRLLTGNAYGGVVSVGEDEEVRELGHFEARLSCGFFSPSGGRVLLAHEVEATTLLGVYDAVSGACLGRLEISEPLGGAVFAPEDDDTVLLWVAAPREDEEEARGVTVRWHVPSQGLEPWHGVSAELACLQDTQRLQPLPGGRLAVSDERARLPFVVDLEAGRCVRGLLHPMSSEHVRAVSLSPDGAWLAVGAFDGRVVVWETQTWRVHAVVCSAWGGWWSMGPEGALREEGGRWTA